MKFNCIIGLFLLFFSIVSKASEQHEKLWLGINRQQNFSESSPWLYLISSELRFIHEDHPWQTVFLEGGLGHTFYSDKSVWLGYRGSGHDPYNQFYQENRLFQQLIWPIYPNDLLRLVSRSRLEEIMRGNQSQTAIRFRKKISLEMKYRFMKRINPYFYNEFFSVLIEQIIHLIVF